MVIQINAEFRITSQVYSWDLEKYTKTVSRETGAETYNWAKFSYHSNLKNAVMEAFRQKLISKDDVVEFSKINNYIEKEILAMLKGIEILK
jgi:hypothetical protein